MLHIGVDEVVEWMAVRSLLQDIKCWLFRFKKYLFEFCKFLCPVLKQIVAPLQDNKVLTIALEGNIDQVQYTDRIKSIVEFLGSRLSLEELTKMWNLQVLHTLCLYPYLLFYRC